MIFVLCLIKQSIHFSNIGTSYKEVKKKVIIDRYILFDCCTFNFTLAKKYIYF